MTLWALAGSWSGALILVGFDPLNEDQRRVMAKHYALAHASPDLLPAEIRRTLPPSCLHMLGRMSERTRKLGKVLKDMDVSHNFRDPFYRANIDLYQVMYEVGILIKRSETSLKKQKA